MAESGYDIKKIFDDSKRCLLNPKDYFSSIPKTGGYVDPIIKALIYGAVSGIFGFVWSLFGARGAGIMFSESGRLVILIGPIIGAFIGLFIGGLILLVISVICGGSSNFEANVRTVASLLVIIPMNAILGFFTIINYSLGSIVFFVITLYGVFMLYQSLLNALDGRKETAKIVCIVIAAIPVLALIGSLAC